MKTYVGKMREPHEESGSPDLRPTLSVVMPVYNEAMYLRSTVEGWIKVLRGLHDPFEFLVFDDGSTDGSGEILDECSLDFPELHVEHRGNRGHGLALREGYETAVGEWVFQTDSDDEVPCGEFDQLWPLRDEFDFVTGRRVGRKSRFARRVISWCARIGVRLFFGSGVRDVNSPFRLMRATFLRTSLQWVPKDTFAPNIHLTGLAVLGPWRVREVPVLWQSHQIGGVSRPIPAGFGKLVSLFAEMWTVSRRARE